MFRFRSEVNNSVLQHWMRSGELLDSSSVALAAGNPELAVALAVQAIRETADNGFATNEAVDAVRWALQRAGVRYDVTPDTPVAVRPGPTGLTGVYVLTPSMLVDFAEAQVDRRLTADECEAFYDGSCPVTPVPVHTPASTPDFGFINTSAQGGRALEGTTVRIANDAA